jgi:hypothetical protein
LFRQSRCPGFCGLTENVRAKVHANKFQSRCPGFCGLTFALLPCVVCTRFQSRCPGFCGLTIPCLFFINNWLGIAVFHTPFFVKQKILKYCILSLIKAIQKQRAQVFLPAFKAILKEALCAPCALSSRSASGDKLKTKSCREKELRSISIGLTSGSELSLWNENAAETSAYVSAAEFYWAAIMQHFTKENFNLGGVIVLPRRFFLSSCGIQGKNLEGSCGIGVP